jgi:mannose-6-phosphate isomerase-like protein (cupin superfamily)
MSGLATRRLPDAADVIAPDGSEVRILTSTPRGSMAHFRLQPGQVSVAVAHRTVEEVWYFLSGTGEIWRKIQDDEQIVAVEQGISIDIPAGAHFQFRCLGSEPLNAVGVTMPPWPGMDEAYAVPGKWT